MVQTVLKTVWRRRHSFSPYIPASSAEEGAVALARRQHVHGWCRWLRCTSRCVPPIVGWRPLVVDKGDLCMAGFAGDDAYHAVFPLFLDRPKILGIHGWYGSEGQVCSDVPGFFASELLHFSASVLLDVEARGGGDAGSLILRRPATPIRCVCWLSWINMVVIHPLRTTTTTTTTTTRRLTPRVTARTARFPSTSNPSG